MPADLFKASGGQFYFVELSASLATILERNETPHRMEKKASKRDIAWSKSNLLKDAENHRLNSAEGEISYKREHDVFLWSCNDILVVIQLYYIKFYR